MTSLPAFKTYDVRGRVPDELDESLVHDIGAAYAAVIEPRRVVVGRDVRHTSEALSGALCAGLVGAGVDVVDIGVCGTEEVYFATWHLGVDGGIMVTASHNPADHNGLKLVRAGARPVGAASGLLDIEGAVVEGRLAAAAVPGRVERVSVREAYVEHLLSYVDADRLAPLRIVSNPGNGGAGSVVDALAPHLPFEVIKLFHEPDGSFPNGVPNPLLVTNREPTATAVRRGRADLGVAWDGDFDRCFLFDEHGGFVEGYYIVGLLAAHLLVGEPGGRVVHDGRLTWNTIDLVTAGGGTPVVCRSGHAFIKERMREVDAIYGGEMSAHHYFRRFGYCDSGMIPWLLVAARIRDTGLPLSELVGASQAAYPVSGEINRRVADPEAAIGAVRRRFEAGAVRVTEVDGLGVEHDKWRFNLRRSDTEALVRLNVEGRGDRALMQDRTAEILALLAPFVEDA